MEILKQMVREYARKHANPDGLAFTPVQGLRMMCVDAPPGELHTTYRPLVCLILQGAKRLDVGTQALTVHAGESVIVSADLPVAGRILQATRDRPYLAIAVELDMNLAREMAAQMSHAKPRTTEIRTLATGPTDSAVLDCVARLMGLLSHPEAVPLLRAGIMQELHYWLLAGQHGDSLRAITARDGRASRIAAAVAVLRESYRSPVPVAQLADVAAMGLTAFHKHFLKVTSLTPLQFQKRLRLIEARRLLLECGMPATRVAFEVGYESVPQFTREYSRLFRLPPRRDAQRVQRSTKPPPADLRP